MISFQFTPGADQNDAEQKLHIGRATSAIMHANHPTNLPSTDGNSLVDLAFGQMRHPMSSAEVSNRNIRKG